MNDNSGHGSQHSQHSDYHEQEGLEQNISHNEQDNENESHDQLEHLEEHENESHDIHESQNQEPNEHQEAQQDDQHEIQVDNQNQEEDNQKENGDYEDMINNYNPEGDDEDQGENEEDYQEESNNKKIKKKLKKKKKKNDEGEDINEQEIQNQSNTINKKQKRKRNQVDEQELQNQVDILKNKMEQAYDNDKERLKKEQPAFEKLKLISEVTQELKSINIQTEFLRTNGLSILLQWLSNNDDGTKPSDELKRKVLILIDTLNVSKEEIEKVSPLAKKIKFFKDNPQEIKEVKLIAKKIFDKWYRIITGTLIDYKNYFNDEMEQKNFGSSSKIDQKQTKNTDALNIYKQKNMNQYIEKPKQKRLNFIYNVSSNIQQEKSKNQISKATQDAYRFLKNMSKKK